LGSFPSETSRRRLIGAALMEMQDRWVEHPQRYIIPDNFPF
jgi:hypothetical protein